MYNAWTVRRGLLWILVGLLSGCDVSGFSARDAEISVSDGSVNGHDGGDSEAPIEGDAAAGMDAQPVDDADVSDPQDGGTSFDADAQQDASPSDTGVDSGSSNPDTGTSPDTGTQQDAGCTPNCNQRSCGQSNGCGGQCGTATDNQCPCDDGEMCTTSDVYTGGVCAGEYTLCLPCGAGTAQNVIRNPSLEDADINVEWSFFTDATGNMSKAAAADAYSCTGAARVQITTVGTNMQFFQRDITAQENTVYRLHFAARSSSGRDIRVAFHQHAGAGDNYGLPLTTFDLTTSWQEFDFEFTSTNITGTVNDGRLRFWFAAATAGEVYWFDDVRLEPQP